METDRRRAHNRVVAVGEIRVTRRARIALGALVLCAAAGVVAWRLRDRPAPGPDDRAPRAPAGEAYPGLSSRPRAEPTSEERLGRREEEAAEEEREFVRRRDAPPRPVRVHGRFVPIPGDPVPEVVLVLEPADGEEAWHDAASSVTLPLGRDGRFDRTLLLAPAFAGVRLIAHPLGSTEVRRFVAVPEDASEVEADLQAPGGEGLRGRVLDAAGRPLASLLVGVGLVAVRAWWRSPVPWPAAAADAMSTQGWARTDGRGEFRFAGLTAPQGACAVAEDQPWLLEESPVRPGADGISVWHAAPAFFVDLAADVDDGSSAAGAVATFTLWSQDGSRWSPSAFALREDDPDPAGRRLATGRWVLTRKSFPPHGRVEVDVRVVAPGCVPWTATQTLVWDARRLELAAALHRRREDETGRLTVTLLEPAASRLKDAEFVVRRREPSADDGWEEVGRIAPSDEASRATLIEEPDEAPPDLRREGWALPAGDAVVSVVTHDGVELCSWTGTVRVPSKGTVAAKVSFPPTGSVRLRPRPGAEKTEEVALEEVGGPDPARRSRWIAVGPDEECVARHVPVGTWRLVRSAAGASEAPKVVVEEGAQAVVELGAPR